MPNSCFIFLSAVMIVDFNLHVGKCTLAIHTELGACLTRLLSYVWHENMLPIQTELGAWLCTILLSYVRHELVARSCIYVMFFLTFKLQSTLGSKEGNLMEKLSIEKYFLVLAFRFQQLWYAFGLELSITWVGSYILHVCTF